MALLPSLSALQLGTPAAPHALEFYIDYVCPFSAKLVHNALVPAILPLISKGGKYEGKIRVILRLQPQPWHASSMLLHEAALAAARVAPEKFLDVSVQFFKHQTEFFDIPASKLSPTQIRAALVSLTAEVIGQDKAGQMADLLVHKTTPNGGTAVTDDLKYNIKMGRQNGIHVTPSATWDGLFQASVSSSWAEKEWTEFFEQNV
ncbi:hypothetical protein CALVIDRAFT_538640 [Calocera viscosa TUFC12733]|uniref:Thioredoxin-like fold domain-containing protein n=1 Tax=Calocera viscosa (strain TUFC12733) TaxID=1330018 RepID=A0A167KPF3_CALVF|nr:hypothetical protein CALVIDRAFT_538640 [Calocera viscosa TUFC12733]